MTHCDAAVSETDATPDALIGRTVGGRFVILRLIGRGGMGSVYAARQLSMDREVAVKVLLPEPRPTPTALRRFLKEAGLAARVKHPNVVPFIDFGQTDDGMLFLVMELLNGRTLGQALRASGTLSVDRAVELCCQLCDALSAAHSAGVVHRDVKPENVYLVPGAGRHGEWVKLLDLGIATRLEGELAATQPGITIGTPGYMSPEQAYGEAIDRRTDIYSVGAILFEMLSGQPPFVGGNTRALLAAHAATPTPRLSSVLASPNDIPPALDAIVANCLAKRPEARYASAAALKAALLAVGSSSLAPEGQDTIDSPVARERVLPSSAASAETPPVLAHHSTDRSPGSGRRRVVGGTLWTLLAVLGSTAWALRSGATDSPEPPSLRAQPSPPTQPAAMAAQAPATPGPITPASALPDTRPRDAGGSEGRPRRELALAPKRTQHLSGAPARRITRATDDLPLK